MGRGLQVKDRATHVVKRTGLNGRHGVHGRTPCPLNAIHQRPGGRVQQGSRVGVVVAHENGWLVKPWD